eukprot:TRINITY_DN3863_c0_g2_i15.p1 TRINITY_DN3863_c0_g2~~TRINITY_DN3863_c0_g2_i15.p1  ORF type:complete len:153 (+),score=0.82 TRINITY_DN3863_c0_g2_i15:501-959(+)
MVSRLFHLNELEITAWSLWLEKLNWELGEQSLESFLFVTGAQAKAYLNPEIEMEIYFQKLGHDFPKVMQAYKSWIGIAKHHIDLNSVEINKEYKRLKQVLYFMNLVFCLTPVVRGRRSCLQQGRGRPCIHERAQGSLRTFLRVSRCKPPLLL